MCIPLWESMDDESLILAHKHLRQEVEESQTEVQRIFYTEQIRKLECVLRTRDLLERVEIIV